MNTTQNGWFHLRLAHHRASTPHPGTQSRCCHALYAWREIDERGNPSPGNEYCYCSGCGRRLRGELSPWYELARADWMDTNYMQRQQIKWRNTRAHKRIKLGLIGSRKVAIDTSNWF